jgi:hypothetical protein
MENMLWILKAEKPDSTRALAGVRCGARSAVAKTSVTGVIAARLMHTPPEVAASAVRGRRSSRPISQQATRNPAAIPVLGSVN